MFLYQSSSLLATSWISYSPLKTKAKKQSRNLRYITFEYNINLAVTFLHAVTLLPKLVAELSVLLPWCSGTSCISGDSKSLKKQKKKQTPKKPFWWLSYMGSKHSSVKRCNFMEVTGSCLLSPCWHYWSIHHRNFPFGQLSWATRRGYRIVQCHLMTRGWHIAACNHICLPWWTLEMQH